MPLGTAVEFQFASQPKTLGLAVAITSSVRPCPVSLVLHAGHPARGAGVEGLRPARWHRSAEDDVGTRRRLNDVQSQALVAVWTGLETSVASTVKEKSPMWWVLR